MELPNEENKIISREICSTHDVELDSAWNVASAYKVLPAVPPLYILERTRVVVHDTPPNIIAERISKSLQQLSFDAKYDGEHATALVSCADQLSFFVRLFQNSDGTKARGIVVEVQKKSGCSFRFHKHARLILRSAAGIKEDTAAASRKIPGLVSGMRRPTLTRSRVEIQKDDTLKVEKEVERSLERAAGLLRKDRFDANLLGMESLVLLTDDQSTSIDKAICAARLLVENSKFDNLRDNVKRYIWPEPEETEEFDEFEREQWDAMHEKALVLLANALGLLAGGSNTTGFDLKKWAVSDTDIVFILVEETKSAASNPHNAYQALRSLNAIVACSGQMKEKAVELGAPNGIAIAQTVGQSRHVLLLEAGEQLLAELGKASRKR